MSRFFRADSSDTSSDSESDYSSSSGGLDRPETQIDQAGFSSDEDIKTKSTPAVKGSGERFLKTRVLSSSSDSDSGKRVVRSAKVKWHDELKTVAAQFRNAMKINDWVAILNEFENARKMLDGAKKSFSNDVPMFYYKLLADSEDLLNETLVNRDMRKKMSGPNAKALNVMKQRLRKHLKEVGDKVSTARETVEDIESDFSSTESESSSSSSSSDSDIGPRPPGGRGRDFWLKKPEKEKKDKPKKKKAAVGVSENAGESRGDWADDEDESGGEGRKWLKKGAIRRKDREEEAAVPAPVPEKPKDPKDVTEAEVYRLLDEVVALRGKKTTTAEEMNKQLDFLNLAAKTCFQKLRVYALRLSVLFDNQASLLTYMEVQHWRNARSLLEELLKIIYDYKNSGEVTFEQLVNITTEDFALPPEEQSAKAEESEGMPGTLTSYVERLDDELIKSLQSIDHKTTEYVGRIEDEDKLLEVAATVQEFCEESSCWRSAARVANKRVEHMYYRHDSDVVKTSETEADESYTSPLTEESSDRSKLLHKLAVLIYQYGDERLKTRTMLCHIYHNALHDRFYDARDMLLMSHLQDNIIHADIPTQILYNRTLIQLGIAAFRRGLFSEAHSCVVEICSSQKVRELLAQGVSMQKNMERTPEEEKAERRRQVPRHMHISMDVVELVHYVCAVLLEVPSMARHQGDRRRQISRVLRKHLDYVQRQAFVPPPENSRESAMYAARALLNGDWQTADKELLLLKGWQLLRGFEQVKPMVAKKIREIGLKTYLFTFATHYDSLSLDGLCELFDLDRQTVYAIVSKLMHDEELAGSWDQPSSTLVMHKSEPSPIQSLALQYAEKIAQLTDSNEHLLQAKMGTSPKERQGQGRDQGRSNRQQTRGQRGRTARNRGNRTKGHR